MEAKSREHWQEQKPALTNKDKEMSVLASTCQSFLGSEH